MANKQTLKNTANRRQEEIRQTVGGSNNLAQNSNSRFDRKNGADKIPVLNVSEYQNLQENVSPVKNIFGGTSITGMLTGGGDENYNRVQELTPLYNALQATRTQNQLDRLGQTDIARGASDALVDDIKNQGQGNLLQRYLNTPYSVPNVISNLVQNATADKGTLTPEMQALGITENDLANWNARQNEAERQEVLSQWAKDNPVVSSINAVPENAFQSISNTLKQIKDYATGTPLQTRETNADIYRRAVSEDIDSNIGQLAYGGANSLADMLFATLLTAPLGGIGGGANAARNVSRAAGAIMGTEKANQVMNSAIERGLTPNQIMGEGVGSGVSTALTEALPLEGILGGNHILSSMLSEGLQEGAEDLVDTAIDELITRMGGNGDKSELHQNYNAYLEAGYDADEAFKNMLVDYGKQVGIDALLGGITGGLMGGGSNLMQGRNIITGRIPTLNVEPTNQVSIGEEASIENQRANENEEIARLNERIKAEQDHLENEYRQEEARKAEQTIPAISNQENVTSNEQNLDRRQIYDILSQNVYKEPEAPNADLNIYAKYAEQMITKLQLFQRPDLVDGVTDAYNAIRNASNQDEEAEAIERFNIVLGNINEEMRNAWHAGYTWRNLPESLTPWQEPMWLSTTRPEQTIPTVTNENVKTIEENATIPTLEQPVVQQSKTVEQPKSEKPKVQSSNLTRTERTQYRRQMESLRDKLSTFGNKKDADRLAKAYDAIANSEGDKQAKAIEKFNNLVNSINEKMAGKTVGITAREVNQDLYEDMKRVTDGYKVRVSKDAIKQLGLSKDTYTELNNATNTRSANRIKFVEKGGTPIDSAYMEMYDLSHGMLPDPTNMAEGDLLKALYNYITEPKSASNEMAYEQSWEDTPATDNRSDAVRKIEDMADDLFDKIEDGISTAEDFSAIMDEMNALVKKNPSMRQWCYDTYMELSNALREKVANADVYDPDINDADLEDLDVLAEEALEGYDDADLESEEIVEEIPRLHNQSSGVHTGRYKQSDVYENTGKKSGVVTEEVENLDEKYKHMMYEQNSERESMEAAQKALNDKGEDAEAQRLYNSNDWSNVDIDEAMMLSKQALEEAQSLDAQGLDSTEAWGYVYMWFEKIKEIGSRTGQELQAFAKWSRSNTPEGLLAETTAIISKANGWNKDVANVTKNANRMAFENGKPQLERSMDINFMKNFLTEASKLKDLPVNSFEYKRVYDNLGKLVNTQIRAGAVEKVRTLLMDNMLGNARTLLTRNAGGNVGFNLIEQLLRRPLSAAIDAGLSKVRNTRRTQGVSFEGYKEWGKGAKQAFKQEWYDFTHGVHSGRSGEVNLANATSQNRTVFKNNKTQSTKGLNYLLNKADNLVRYGLSIGDRWAYEGAYYQTKAELEKLYREGKLDRTVTNKDGETNTFKLSREEFEKISEDMAKLNGLEACYQDDSEMAQAFLAARRLVNKMSRGILGTDILSQFTIPFAKTPANIIQRAIEYSPLGLAKNAVQTIREVTDPAIGFNQRRFSVDTSRNIIGSALFALGIGLAKSGAMTGGYSEDKDMRQAQKEAGMQEYALHNPFGLNADVDISWLPVLGNVMVSAAAANDAANDPTLSNAQRFGQGLTAGLKTQFETSALQGLSRFIGGQGSFGNSGGDVVTNAKDTLMSGMTQFVPSLLRQFANSTDPYQRQLSGPNPDDYYFNSVLSAIPGLRQTLEPKIGRTGEALEQNHAQTRVGQFINNFINPATVTYGTEDKVRDEAMRLFESTGNNIAFQPSVTMNELKVDGHVPTAQEFTEYQRAAYGAMNQIASDFIDSDVYENMTDGDRESTLADIYSAIKSVEKANVIDLDKDKLSGAAKAYDQGGEDALLDYVIAKNYLSQMGLQNNEKNREIIQNTLNEGGAEALQEMIEQSQELEDAGLDTNMQFKYDHATNYIPSLSPTEFADTWQAINTDNNSSIKQAEVLDYLNQNPDSYDANTALQYWNAYGSNWTKIPVLNPNTGLWEAKKV